MSRPTTYKPGDRPTDYKGKLGLDYEPSRYQTAVWDWIEHGSGHAVVNAVAGSGKTTVLVAACELLVGHARKPRGRRPIKGCQIMAVAFNKAIERVLDERLPSGVWPSTLHSHGNSAIRYHRDGVKHELDGNKYKNMVKSARAWCADGELFGRKLPDDTVEMMRGNPRTFPYTEICKLIDLARANLVDCELPQGDFIGELDEIAAEHGLDWEAEYDCVVANIVQRAMQAGKANTDVIDYGDQVWMPVVLRLRPWQYEYIMVDECQDLSACALQLVKMSIRRGGRVMFVGDPKQAIYGFAGADTRSFEKIVEFCGGRELLLSVCYRCPTSVIDLAKEYCPEIQARPGAPVGTVEDIKQEKATEAMGRGDLVLCRRTAPLVRLLFTLIAAGKPAAVKGRSIGEAFARDAKKVDAASRKTRQPFAAQLVVWEDEQRRKLAEREPDSDRRAEALEILIDRTECIRIIWASAAKPSIGAFEDACEDLFSDRDASTQLSTIHRAKGLEAPRVYILDPDPLLDGGRARTAEQAKQELHLAYVAVTRSMGYLGLVQETSP